MTLQTAGVETRLPVGDLDRARAWYADKLDLHPREERDGGLRYQLAEGGFCLFASSGRSTSTFTQLAFTVDDIEACVAELEGRGVVFETAETSGMQMRESIVEVDDNYPSKGTGERGAFFRDSEGNMIALGESTGRPTVSIVRGVSVLLGSSDPERLREFYADVFQTSPDPEGWLSLGNLGLLCDGRNDVAGRTAEPGRAVLTVEVTDAQQVVDRLERRGVEWIAPLERRPDGLFSTAIDPDGNYLQILQLTPAYHLRTGH